MASNSFDIVSQVDLQEVRNAVTQADREVKNRFDLKKADSEIGQEGDDIVVSSADEYSLEQTLEVLKGRLVRRGVDLKALEPGKVEEASGGRARQRISLKQGISTEIAKKIVAEIKKLKLKVQGSIQGDTVRVSGKKRDDLQAVINRVKELDLDLPLSFTNFRSS